MIRKRFFVRLRAAASLIAAGALVVSLSLQAAEGLEKAHGYFAAGNGKAAVIELKSALQQDPGDSAARLLLGEVYLAMQSGAEAEKELRRAAKLGSPPSAWRSMLLDALLLQRKYSDMLDLIDEAGEAEDPRVQSELAAMRGRALGGLERRAEAEVAYTRALELDPDNERAAVGRIMLVLRDGKFDAAAVEIDRFLEKHPNNSEMLTNRAELYRTAGDLKNALELFTRAQAQAPEDVRPVVGRATVLVAQGEMDAAKSDLDRADEIRKDLAMTRYLRGLIAFQEKDWETARPHLESVLNAIPGHVQSQLLLGVISFSANDLQIAEEYLSRVVSAMPNNLHVIKILGATRIKLREPKRAIEVLEPAARQVEDAQLMALLGSAYMLDGNEAAGQEWLSRAVEVSPDVAALRTQLALTLLAGGNTEGAIDELKAAVDLGQDVLQADVLLVMAHVKKGQHEQGLEASLALEKRHPDRALPYNLTGLAYLAKGELDLAEERFDRALEIDPEFIAAMINLARVDIARDDMDAAKKRYESVLERKPTHLATMLGLAALAERRSDPEAMVGWLERAQDANPGAVQPGLALSRHYLASGDALRSLSIARDLSGRFPNNPKVLEALARAQVLGGEATNAVRTLEQLSDLNPENHVPHYLVGVAKANTGDQAGARLAFEQAILLKPDFVEARYSLSMTELQDGRFREALEIAEGLRRDFPNSAVGASLEGVIYREQKRPEKAAKAFEAAYALQQTSSIVSSLATAYAEDGRRPAAIELLAGWTAEHSDDARALALLAQFLQLEQRDTDAVRAYEALIDTGQKHYIILNNLAWLYQKLGDERAVDFARQAYDLEPTRPEVADTYGWILVKNGNTREGLSILQQAYVSFPTQSEIGYHVAVGLEAEGRREEAKKLLRRLLRETPNFGQAEEARALLAELEQ